MHFLEKWTVKHGCPTLESDRLILRPLKNNDDEAIFRLRSHPEVFKYVGIEPYQSIERAQKFIKAVKNDIRKGEAYFWGVALKEEDVVIGTFCIWNFEHGKTKAEIGYELHPEYHHKGIMREAMQTALAFVEKKLSIEVLDAITHEENLPSIKLLDDFQFAPKGRAIDVDASIEEGPEMLLYRKLIKRKDR